MRDEEGAPHAAPNKVLLRKVCEAARRRGNNAQVPSQCTSLDFQEGRYPLLAAALREASEAAGGLPVVSAGVSSLHPGAHIRPHTGPSNARWNIHLGLVVAHGDDVRMRVGEEWRGWREGRTLVFDDSFEHEVRHAGREERIILDVNVPHPAVWEEERRKHVDREKAATAERAMRKRKRRRKKTTNKEEEGRWLSWLGWPFQHWGRSEL